MRRSWRRRWKFIEAKKPDLLFVHFPDVDGVGHAKGWGSAEQLACIEKTDRQLGELLAALDRAGLRASTFFLVTSDHGGAGLTHGADDARSRHIPWVVVGPGVRKNFDLTLGFAGDSHRRHLRHGVLFAGLAASTVFRWQAGDRGVRASALIGTRPKRWQVNIVPRLCYFPSCPPNWRGA